MGLANSLIAPGHVFGDGVNWAKVQDTGLALLVSPIIGFVVAGLLLLLAKLVIRYPALFKEPPAGQPPPLPVRALLFLTCTGVSFAHGSNDGQKGMGLVMLILIGVLPGVYAINPTATSAQIQSIATARKNADRFFANAAVVRRSARCRSSSLRRRRRPKRCAARRRKIRANRRSRTTSSPAASLTIGSSRHCK